MLEENNRAPIHYSGLDLYPHISVSCVYYPNFRN